MPTISVAVLIAAGLVTFGWLMLRSARLSKDGEWHGYPLYFQKVTCVDGRQRSGYLQRRWAAGAWQYRAETEEEASDRFFDEAI